MSEGPADEPWLISLATAVSAGEAVDWPAARARATSDEAPVVEELHRLSQIVAGRGTSNGARAESGAAANGAGGDAWPAVRSWRTLLVLEPLASGFSGDVHRAWDTQLDREVAVKFLHQLVDGTAPSLREARALARVRHPNVVMVYGAEHDSGQSGLWMELIDGETLADAVTARGPMSAREAAGIGIDVCRAVSALHAHGLVHRDVKAANVMREVGGRIVLMDFSGAHGIDDAHPPRQGTPIYMAPELLAGERATPASDIYAIGVLLFFLLTGRHPVEGETLADLEAAHEQHRRVRLLDARPDLPEALVRVVERAIAAPQDARYHTVGELEHALGAIFGAGPSGRPRLALPGWGDRRSSLATLGLGAALLALLLAAAAVAWRSGLATNAAPAASDTRIEFDIVAQEPLRLDPTSNDARVSPDGRVVVFSAWANGTQLLYQRAIGSSSIHPIVGTEGAAMPFWSADSRFVGFHASGLLKRVPIDGGPVTNICPISQFGGGAWNRDGVIVFSQVTSLWTIAAGGGTPQRFPIPAEIGPDAVAVGPAFRPDQQTFTYRIGFGAKDTAGTYLARLQPTTSTRLFDLGPNTVLGRAAAAWISNGALMTQALDPATLQRLGAPATIEGGVLGNDGQAVTPGLSLSDSGVLVYRKLREAATRLMWFDMTGRPLGTLETPPLCRNPEFAPKGDRVAVECTDPTTGRRDIWLVSEGEAPIRLTDAPGGASDPVWSPDGQTIAFSSNPRGIRDLFVRQWAASGEPRPIYGSASTKYPNSWSKDGSQIAFTERGMGRGWNIWTLDVRTGAAKALVAGDYDDIEPQFSPDRRRLAFSSNRSGRWAVYVQDLQAPATAPRMVSAGLGESDPRWSPSGDRLYFLSGDRRLMALPTRDADGAPILGATTPLFASAAIGPIGIGLRFNYDVHPDGRRLLMLVGAGPRRELPALTVRVGWMPSSAP